MFVKPSGMPYYRFLRSLHEACLFDWYLEIGCRSGESFAPVRSKTVAVDPFFRAEINIIGRKPALHVFQATSDEFFASGFLARNGIRLGLAFLDGMHLVEYLLRDFMHTEAAMAPGGVILLHDCVPYGPGMMTRDLSRLPKGSWTGDVWKMIPILRMWRPDLTLTVLDCRSTGLVCVSGLDPDNRVLAGAYDRIVADWVGVELEAYGVERFFASFQMASARAERAAGFPLFRQAAVEGVGLEPVPVTP